MFRNRKKYLVIVVTWLMVLVFTYAATSKLLDFEQFTIQLGQSPLLSAFADLVSIGVIALEFILVLLLAFSNTRTLGLLMSFGLMVMFTTYIFIILHYSDYIPCSCGGVIEKLSWNQHLIFNTGLITLCAIGFLLAPYPLNPIKNHTP